MIIHVVQPGETIHSIANYYGISAQKLVQDNELTNPNNLVVGQTIVILYPKETYIVQEGDTLEIIAVAYNITINQLLRNNPTVSCGEFLYPGETLVISYDVTSKGKMVTNGFAYPFINHNVLKKALPFLTSLSIYAYKVTAEGGINDIEDEELIILAKAFGVAPIMVITTFTGLGNDNGEGAHNILINPELQNLLIENILRIMHRKGYCALSIDSQNVCEEDSILYEEFVSKLTKRLNKKGYEVTVIIATKIEVEGNTAYFKYSDFTVLSQVSNGILLLTYQWGHSLRAPIPMITIQKVKEFLDKVVSQIPAEKITIGIPCIGYDWELPFIPNYSDTNSLSHNAVIDLAIETNSTIQYDINAQAPYFFYTEKRDNNEVKHIVWFRDARSIDVLTSLVPEYGLQGIGTWNLMQYFAQMWLVVNSQYEFDRRL